MGEFDKAERDDRELDRADEHEMRQRDWDDLHGDYEDRVWAFEAEWRAAKKRQANNG